MKTIASRAEQAEALFKSGMNCAQAVLFVFAPEAGLDTVLCAKVASGFGGGMGRMGLTCGAVTGAFMVLGLKHGAASADDKDAKEKTARLVREFAVKFRARNGDIVCRELLGCDISTAEGHEEARMKGFFGTICPKLVRDAVEILEEME